MTIERLGRDARNIVIAKVKAGRVISEEPDNESRGYDMTLSFERELKARAHWNGQPTLQVSTLYPMSVALPQTGSSVILFFKDDSFGQYSMTSCSPLALNDANLAEVRRGIAEDNRPLNLPD